MLDESITPLYNGVMLRYYEYRIYPDSEQIILLLKHFGCKRFIWNWALALMVEYYERYKRYLTFPELSKRLTELKKELTWLREVNSQSLQAALRDLDQAFKNFFAGRAKFPRFKARNRGKQTFRCPQNAVVDFLKGLLNIPKFKKGIKAVFHREFEGRIVSATLKLTPSGKFFVSILVEEPTAPPTPAPVTEENTVGLDVGLDNFLIDSRGNKVGNPRFLKESHDKLAVEQKKFNRTKKGSKNREKQRIRVARKYEKITFKREDFLHKITAELVYKSHDTSFAVEDLNIKGMIKNRKLSRVISDVGWGKFFRFLEYKCLWFGKNLLHIGRFEPSSKTCSSCDYVMEKLPLSVRRWACPQCHAEHDRDVNAAINIKRFALKNLADVSGHDICIKSPPETIPVSAGVSATHVDVSRHGSQEAPTIAPHGA